jgi:outer membrane receptor for ferrienterochelin and colicins
MTILPISLCKIAFRYFLNLISIEYLKKEFSLVSRYLYEDRWGGEMQWNKTFRGGSEVYGESIYTLYEFLGKYELPVQEKMYFQFSLIGHNQNSVYGNSTFLANQNCFFGQLLWDKNWNNHWYFWNCI